MKLNHGLILLFLVFASTGCDQLGLETPAAELAREEAEGKAIGGGCRQAGRGLEDCYQLNRRAPKAAIYSGWRDMDVYMRENNIGEAKAEVPALSSEPKEMAPPQPAMANEVPALQQPAESPKAAPTKRPGGRS
jgi:hypothetical protein